MAEGINSTFTSRVRKTNSSNTTANVRRSSRQSSKRDIHSRVVLEKVLGITTSNSSGLACDPNSGFVAYPAGCVIVILNPKKNKQSHIFNTSRKTFSALAFSHNGKYLVTGESGHMPCVRVWDVTERTQVAEVQCHKYGVACVAFSTNGSYIVSVGFEHDRTVSVWEWKRGTVIASNKVSSRVLAVSFSEDSSYFVTAGNRHVKFWYLDASKERRVNSTVPLIGRSGLLGEHQNSEFCDLACGRGTMASSTYCITHTGLLCQFNSNRQLDLWVDLKTSSARCLSVSESFVFCGCADGTVRVFSPQNLHYITTLHRPHCLGVDVSQGVQPGHLFTALPDAEYPDTLALTHDPMTGHLTCVFNDHSVYVWDVRDINNVGKVFSALYHSNCVWSVETYPELEDSAATLLPGSFFTCSSDNTIRLWNSDFQQSHNQNTDLHRNLYSQDLVKIVYVDEDTRHLKALAERVDSSLDGKFGIRVLGISPDGQHLAAGDRSGNLRIFGLFFMDELLKIEAHDSEVLCLAFSPAETGLQLLASASRDRLIHIFNMENNYSLVQTVYDHSASVTAMKFTGVGSKVCMVSCGADKSIYFRSAEKSSEGLAFSRSHHVVEKSTLYDMDLDATSTHTAIACQDRNIRVYNVKSGKMKKCFKGSATDDGTLLKVQLDPSGMFLATSCSDKSICIFDYESGECVATLFGHSEIVTGMKFSPDCRHLITVCGDSCVFVWRLCSQMTNSMRKRLAERRRRAGQRNLQRGVPCKEQTIRRETYIAVPRSGLAKTEEIEADSTVEEIPHTPARTDTTIESLDLMMPQTNGRLPMWARRLGAGVSSSVNPTGPSVTQCHQPQGRWAVRADPLAVRSVLETWSLQLPLSHTPSRAEEDEEDCEEEKDGHEDVDFHPQSLDSLLDEEEEGDVEEEDDTERGSEQFSRLSSSENNDYILYPANSTALSTAGEGEFDVKALCEGVETDPEEELSPDSACSAESDQVHSDQAHDQDTDSLSQASSVGSSGVEEEEDEEPATLLRQHFDTLAVASNEKFNTDLRILQPTNESNFLNPRLSLSTRFLSRFQSRVRGTGAGSGSVCRPGTCLPSIQDESSISSASLEKTEDDSILIAQTCGPNTTRSDQKKSQRGDITDKAVVSQATVQNSANNQSIFDTKPANLSFDKVSSTLGTTKSSHQSDMAPFASSYTTKSSSVDEKVEEPKCGNAVLQNASLSNQDLSLNLESKENLLPQCTHSTEHLLPIPEKQAPPPAPPALGNHSARAALHLDLSAPHGASMVPASIKTLRRQMQHIDPPCRQALVSPTEMRSLGKDSRKRISNIEKNLTPKSSTRLSSGRALSAKCSPLATPKKSFENAQPLAQCNTVESTTSEVKSEGAKPVDSDECMTLQMCKEIVNELQHTMQKAASFYSKLQAISELSEQHVQMKSILQEAFAGILQELDLLCPQNPCLTAHQTTQQPPEDSPSRQLRDDRAMALLEKYSEMLLLRMAEKKTDCS
ncbi:WD repeat-containing protein 62 isoform X1 [Pygocentrus nattereri]|uniref:Anaphase-promoting complex subunit 4 WD40 domain-containing protein n=1 Tax=Pygocentrus nattereri TaxID=42514 RepID=A0A3B4BV34_PYGNA|nr:WD repeat-containing protein 62 isoform X1 [Pygocentrus nattereri]